MVKKTSNLIEYEVIMDTDLAIVLTMLSKSKDTSILNEDVRTLADSPSALKNLLLFRKDKNPLSAILDEKYTDSFGVLLKELEESCEDEIIDKTRPTDILIYVASMEMNKDLIDNLILCKSPKQEERIKKFLSETAKTTSDPVTDMKDHDCLFVKYTDNFYNYSGLQGKHLYIYNARFNLGEQYRLPDLALLLSRTNRIRTIDPYKNLRVPNLEAKDEQ